MRRTRAALRRLWEDSQSDSPTDSGSDQDSTDFTSHSSLHTFVSYTSKMEEANTALAVSLRKRIVRLHSKAQRVRDRLATQKGTDTAETSVLAELQETLDTIKAQKEEFETLTQQLLDVESNPTALEEDDIRAEEFEQAMFRATADGKYLLSQRSIYCSVSTLEVLIRGLTTAYETSPDNAHSLASNRVNVQTEELETALKISNMPDEEELRQRGNLMVERAHSIQGRVAGTRATDAKPPVATTKAKAHLKLKYIEVPTFSGRTEDWMGFYRLFSKAVHSNDELDEDTKLTYLVQAIQDPRVKQEISERLDEPGAYTRIMKELEQTHDKPRWMHRKYTEKLRTMAPQPRTREGLMLLLSEGHLINNGLLRLKGGDINMILTSTMEAVMDTTTRSLWNQKTDSLKHTPPVEDLFRFLKDQADQLEDAKGDKVRQKLVPRSRGMTNSVTNSTPHNNNNNNQRGGSKPSSQAHGGTPTNNRSNCPLCQGTHPLFYCPTFEGLAVSVRKEKVMALKLCLNCLKPHHMARECNSSFRCKAPGCGRKHNSLLHEERSGPPATSTQQANAATHNDSDEEDAECLLMTARVTLLGPAGQITVRALLDSGSTLSIITDRLAKQLNLKATGKTVSISGIKSSNSSQLHPMKKVELASEFQPSWRTEINVASMKEVIRKLPFQNVPHVREMPHFKGLHLADSHFDQPGKIELLLGQNIWRHLFLDGRIRGSSTSQPEAWKTVFGWTVLGNYGHTPTQHTINHITASVESNQASDAILARFQELEEPSVFSTPFTAKEIKVEEHYEATHSYNAKDRRYTVKLPKVENPPQLGESRTQAINRARANEQSLIRRGRYGPFQKVMEEYIALGHAVQVNGNQPHPQHLQSASASTSHSYFMPVHSVAKETSSTTKVRAVFDASAKTTSHASLNDLLAVGPTLHPTIDKILLRFRQYPVAISSDVAKMYREVLLHPEDQPLHKYIWRESPDEPWKEFMMTRVTFGVAASPYLAVKTLQQTGADHGEEHPTAQWHIQHSFYVDDLLGGASSVEEATQLYHQLTSILEKANFHLRKWRSSSSQVLEVIPQEIQESVPTQELVDQHCATYPKALGVSWDSGQDTMCTNISLPENFQPTKRGVISDVARTFDVLGWISPAILPMKMLYRDLWKEGLDWDEPVSEEQASRHRTWRGELPLLKEVQLPRCYTRAEAPSSIQLHGFADASINAYSAVIYLRATYPTQPPTVQLVISKSKVSPLKTRTIPQLELCGANLLARLMSTTSQTLGVPLQNIWAYSDNTAVLGWLGGESGRYCVFSGHRIASTIILLPSQHWFHVPTDENPADAASRGVSAAELRHHKLWWHGPPWLAADPVKIPHQPTEEVLAEHRKIEMKPEPKVVMAVMETAYYEQQQNSYMKLVRVTGWMLRFSRRCLDTKQEGSSHLTTAEGQKATSVLLQRSQLRSFSPEIAATKAGKDISSRSRILVLHPIMGKGNLLRVGGRLWNSKLPYHTTHPIILAAGDHFTAILFRYYHLLLGHCGPSTLLTHAANLYHVLGGRTLSKAVCRKCITCRKQAARASSQLLGQLPPVRVEPQYVFLHTGMDFCGPFLVRQGYTRKPVEIKVYLAIFICMVTKAVHLEVVSDLKTPAFIASLDRFVARRGLPLHLYSDNGSNYNGAKNQLFYFYKMLSSTSTQDAIHGYVFQHRITWHNIPQRAPHFGGLWEAAVKSTKFHLKRIVGQERLTFEELSTITCNIESFLNSRPLGPVTSHDLEGSSPLTPSHFLIGRAARAYPQEPVTGKPTTLQRWDICKKATQEFWDRWSQEYIQQLQKATKWHKSSRNFQVNDLVMLTDGNHFKCQWSMAKVIKVYPGRDGLVRAVDVQLETRVLPTTYHSKEQLAEKMKTTTSIFRRPITKLALLLAADEVPGDTVDLDNPVPSPESGR